MSPLPANDTGAPVTLADLLAQAADLQRHIDPAEPMTRDYPGCDALVQNIDVDYAYIRQSYYQRDPNGTMRSQSRNINILEGVDMKSKDVQRLLSNILAAQASEVECALMENA